MLFNTLSFAKFFGVVFVIYWVVARYHGARLVVLLGASYAFYAAWNWRFLPLLLASSTADYVLARCIDNATEARHRRAWLTVTVVVNLGLLGFFKYAMFLAESLRHLGEVFPLGQPGAMTSALKIALPVGISFYTFESMSYVIDVYRRDLPVCRSYPRYLLFVAFFPHLVAGPIVRPTELLPQLAQRPRFHPDTFSRGLFLCAIGLLKKVIIGDYLATNLVDRVFERPVNFSAVETLAGVYGYAFQIYGDFSGYTDIARGLALLLDIRLPENFHRPYAALSLPDFWRRWHISLSSWLRDYLYIPLGGSRGATWKTYRNLLLTMVLGGLWHGASWTFVFWGLLHGAALAVARAWERWRLRKPISSSSPSIKTSPVAQFARWFFTFHYVCFAWIFFRAPSFSQALAVLRQLLTGTTFHPNLPVSVLLVLTLAAVTHGLSDSWLTQTQQHFVRLPAPVQGALLFLTAVVLREVSGSVAVPFVYFQF